MFQLAPSSPPPSVFWMLPSHDVVHEAVIDLTRAYEWRDNVAVVYDTPQGTSRRVTPRHAATRRVTPCHAASRRVTPRHAASRRVTPRHAASRRVTPRHAASRRVTPRHAASSRVKPRQAASRRVTSRHAASRRVTPRHAAASRPCVAGLQLIGKLMGEEGLTVRGWRLDGDRQGEALVQHLLEIRQRMVHRIVIACHAELIDYVLQKARERYIPPGCPHFAPLGLAPVPSPEPSRRPVPFPRPAHRTTMVGQDHNGVMIVVETDKRSPVIETGD